MQATIYVLMVAFANADGDVADIAAVDSSYILFVCKWYQDGNWARGPKHCHNDRSR